MVSNVMKWWMVAGLTLGLSLPVSATHTDHLTQQPAEMHVDQQTQAFTAEDFNLLRVQQQRPIIALVLGSGGARGYAHAGEIGRAHV